ncbi:MAG TPA: MFS transporter [Bryobacteraceae bacterium]
MDSITNGEVKVRSGGLWRHSGFVKLWTGQTISELGSRITREGLPLTAVLVLNAQPFQMGLIMAVGAASALLFGVIAGVFVDRMRRRPIMIGADLARSAILFSIPAAAYFHVLTMAQLYVVIALTGFFTVFFDVAYQSYLPSLVERENLLEGNSKLAMSTAAAEIAGPSLTGMLVQLLTAPIAILFDAVSFLFSALCVSLIRKPEPAPQAPAIASDAKEEAMAGLRFVVKHPLLRPLAGFFGGAFLFFGFVGPLYVLYAIRELHLGPAALGFAIAVGGVGSMIGSSLAPRIGRRLGLGRTFIGAVLVLVFALALIPLARGPAPWPLVFLMASQLLGDIAFATYLVNELTLQQTVTPENMLGRVNAAMQLMGRGVYPIGAMLGGILAGQFGMRATYAIAVCGLLGSSMWLIASPVRNLREMPGGVDSSAL